MFFSLRKFTSICSKCLSFFLKSCASPLYKKPGCYSCQNFNRLYQAFNQLNFLWLRRKSSMLISEKQFIDLLFKKCFSKSIKSHLLKNKSLDLTLNEISCNLWFYTKTTLSHTPNLTPRPKLHQAPWWLHAIHVASFDPL